MVLEKVENSEEQKRLPVLVEIDEQAIAGITRNIAQCERLVREVLREGVHYGRVPGVRDPFLWEPGADNIMAAFNCYADPVILSETLTPELISYAVKSNLIERRSGRVVATGVGSSSTWEVKHKYRWVEEPEEFGYSEGGLKTKEEKGRTLYRIPNPEYGELQHSILKAATKRAEVDAVQSLPGVSTVLREKFGKKQGAEWDWFWGRVRDLGFSAQQVYYTLEVPGMKEWLAKGRTLQEAVESLAKKGPPPPGTRATPPTTVPIKEEAPLFEEEPPVEEFAPPMEEKVIERDWTSIKTENAFNRACHEDFKLQPRESLKAAGYSTAMGVRNWGEAYQQVAATMGFKVVMPSI